MARLSRALVAMVMAVAPAAASTVASPAATAAPTAAAPATAAVGTAGAFVPVESCRLVDTRVAGGRSTGTVRTFRAAGTGGDVGAFAAQGGTPGGCGVPESATALKVAVTAVDPDGVGYLRAWPAGTTPPTASFLNYHGRSITNAGALAIATDASIADLSVRTFGSATHLVIDLQGYVVPAADAEGGTTFVPVTPCRVVDTRRGDGSVAASTERTWQVTGTGPGFAAQGGRSGGCGIPDDAVAVETTLTATEPASAGYLRAWPAGTPPATTTFLNYPGRWSTTNTGALRLAGGPSTDDLTVRAINGRTHVVVDVQGYYAPAGGQGAELNPVTPCRIVDTRKGGGRVAAGSNRTFRVTGSGDFAGQGGYPGGCGIPASAVAVEATVSVVEPTGTGHVRTWPAGLPEPNATILNFRRNVNITNTGATTIATSAAATDLTVGVRLASAHVVIDIQGWYSSAAFATDVSAGAGHSCALMGSATVRCWGSNIDGELGDGTTTSRASAAAVPGLTTVAEVAAGADHTCARRTGGTVACWGANTSGQLGDGTTTASSRPVEVSGLSGVTSISAGLLFTCAAQGDGTVACWGRNDAGQLGVDPATTPTSAAPITVPGLDGVDSVTTGHQHACARRTDGTVRCWGDDSSGQLGDGPTDRTATGPVVVAGLTGAGTIGAGHRHTCATSAGTVRCWGSNANGRLGTGTTTSSPTPVTATGITDAVQVTVGGGHTCAALADGGVRCWGLNAFGQLGDGTTTARPSPTPVPGATGAGAIDAGSDHTCVRVAGGTVRCWGYNTTGQVGDGTIENRSTPVTVLGI